MNIKVGDLAVIVGERPGMHDGRIVEVICYMGPGPVSFNGSLWYESYHKVWLCRSRGSPLVAELGDVAHELPIPEHCLRPIRGDKKTETTDQPETMRA